MSAKGVMNDFFVLGGGVFLKRVGDELEIEVHRDHTEEYNVRLGGSRVPVSRLLDLIKVVDPEGAKNGGMQMEPFPSADKAELRQLRERVGKYKEAEARALAEAEAPPTPEEIVAKSEAPEEEEEASSKPRTRKRKT